MWNKLLESQELLLMRQFWRLPEELNNSTKPAPATNKTRSVHRTPTGKAQAPSVGIQHIFPRRAGKDVGRAEYNEKDAAEETEGKRSPSKIEKKSEAKNKKSIGFAEMARTISSKWKAADEETMAKYKKLALVEKGGYRHKMEGFNEQLQEILEQSRVDLEATVDEETKRNYFDSDFAPNP
jgi:hypothetical protein